MYFIINDFLTLKEEKIYTKNGVIAKIKELYTPEDTLKVSSDYFKEYLANKSVHNSLADVTVQFVVEDCIDKPYAISYKCFSIRCVKEYEVEGIEEQLFGLDELTEPLFYYDQDLTFNMATKWFKTTLAAKELDENPLGINWEVIVKKDYDAATFNYEYSDELVNMYIDAALERISKMSSGDMVIINDLKVTCH